MADEAPWTRGGPASLRELGRTLLDMLQTRGELLTLEFCQERDRVARLLLYGALLLLFAFAALVMSGVFFVALYWDTPHRLLTIALAAATPALAALGCAAALARQMRTRRRPFDASLLALRADVAALQ